MRSCVGSPPPINRIPPFWELPRQIVEEYMNELIAEQCGHVPDTDDNPLRLPPDLARLTAQGPSY